MQNKPYTKLRKRLYKHLRSVNKRLETENDKEKCKRLEKRRDYLTSKINYIDTSIA